MRVGIVNDSVMACEVLRRVVASVPGQEVAWVARDGEEAVAMAKADVPDIVLMDLFMPRMDGVEATRRIMAEAPCAILVVTATVSGHIQKVYQAMGYGALDAVDTPIIGPGGQVAEASPLLRKIDVIARLVGKAPARGEDSTVPAMAVRPVAAPADHPLIVLGSSTGGPFALAEILPLLPPGPEASVVIVQHVDAAFAPGLAQWLGEFAGRKVDLAVGGDAPAPGKILLSATGDHLVMQSDRRLYYSAEPRLLNYRPSVDVFFKSVARHWPRPGVAALLTGMGRDGAEGLAGLRRLGWRTIAQDEETSVVWGMPRAAVELDGAEFVLPLPRIGPVISNLIQVQSPGRAQTRPAPR
ncbi:Chemotaxis response regulator protein-glutamate methylesterase [Aquisphaera giovannonii]|uniref:Protein-glutamate methylesterase/protein-glutamine glutaminase n=1 Tax=Aquisphaera giovannonii TaxID=406548 RepID=A0A5B9VUJ1_9BACT|nr:chemotaxis-specific protein-glutamate methyltransferase CheB [Aquisphaera giovannonii]QEH31928.1 Chemotaxis response regulator protein-glutamate methylesterase [Aquisphaera giovannonii]